MGKFYLSLAWQTTIYWECSQEYYSNGKIQYSNWQRTTATHIHGAYYEAQCALHTDIIYPEIMNDEHFSFLTAALGKNLSYLPCQHFN